MDFLIFYRRVQDPALGQQRPFRDNRGGERGHQEGREEAKAKEWRRLLNISTQI